ncbi:hypothetical protein TWF694_001505 [Orbilia ellipsospora]|uniref:Uncharacterized protein n=1 Tax=Orbilia ellipsospora TaxID=2528407 RepID=A0AAV9XV65_9PEZI
MVVLCSIVLESYRRVVLLLLLLQILSTGLAATRVVLVTSTLSKTVMITEVVVRTLTEKLAVCPCPLPSTPVTITSVSGSSASGSSTNPSSSISPIIIQLSFVDDSSGVLIRRPGSRIITYIINRRRDALIIASTPVGPGFFLQEGVLRPVSNSSESIYIYPPADITHGEIEKVVEGPVPAFVGALPTGAVDHNWLQDANNELQFTFTTSEGTFHLGFTVCPGSRLARAGDMISLYIIADGLPTSNGCVKAIANTLLSVDYAAGSTALPSRITSNLLSSASSTSFSHTSAITKSRSNTSRLIPSSSTSSVGISSTTSSGSNSGTSSSIKSGTSFSITTGSTSSGFTSSQTTTSNGDSSSSTISTRNRSSKSSKSSISTSSSSSSGSFSNTSSSTTSFVSFSTSSETNSSSSTTSSTTTTSSTNSTTTSTTTTSTTTTSTTSELTVTITAYTNMVSDGTVSTSLFLLDGTSTLASIFPYPSSLLIGKNALQSGFTGAYKGGFFLNTGTMVPFINSVYGVPNFQDYRLWMLDSNNHLVSPISGAVYQDGVWTGAGNDSSSWEPVYFVASLGGSGSFYSGLNMVVKGKSALVIGDIILQWTTQNLWAGALQVTLDTSTPGLDASDLIRVCDQAADSWGITPPGDSGCGFDTISYLTLVGNQATSTNTQTYYWLLPTTGYAYDGQGTKPTITVNPAAPQ